MELNIFCDGGARGNPGPAASAFVVYERRSHGLLTDSTDEGKLRHKCGKYLGTATNNVAEYSAVIEALKWVKEQGSKIAGQQVSQVDFYLDSNLVVQQLKGNFKVKDENLKRLWTEAKELMGELRQTEIDFSYVPRAKNFEADELVNETLDEQASKIAG